jgi:hypothetical protein
VEVGAVKKVQLAQLAALVVDLDMLLAVQPEVLQHRHLRRAQLDTEMPVELMVVTRTCLVLEVVLGLLVLLVGLAVQDLQLTLAVRVPHMLEVVVLVGILDQQPVVLAAAVPVALDLETSAQAEQHILVVVVVLVLVEVLGVDMVDLEL